jgi:hypothetical protein
MKLTTTAKPMNALRLLVIHLLLVPASLIILPPHLARASIETPFHGNFVTKFTTTLEFPILYVTVNGKGDATYMGATTASTDDQVSNLTDGSGSATYILTADNGDTLTLALAIQPGGTLNVEGGVTFSGTYTVVRGTGRFRKNTGSGLFAGSALFLNPTEGIGSFSLVGLLITR